MIVTNKAFETIEKSVRYHYLIEYLFCFYPSGAGLCEMTFLASILSKLKVALLIVCMTQKSNLFNQSSRIL